MTSLTTLYGIKNCDTVKKALKYLEQHQINYLFIDIKKSLTLDLLQQFQQQIPLTQLINRQSTTWRKLDEASKKIFETPSLNCFNLLLEYPTLLKRPLLQHQGKIINGFSEVAYQQLFNSFC